MYIDDGCSLRMVKVVKGGEKNSGLGMEFWRNYCIWGLVRREVVRERKEIWLEKLVRIS